MSAGALPMCWPGTMLSPVRPQIHGLALPFINRLCKVSAAPIAEVIGEDDEIIQIDMDEHCLFGDGGG